MTSEHHDTKPASGDDPRFENVRLREQLDDLRFDNERLREQLEGARAAVVPLKTGVDQLTSAVDEGSDYRQRNQVAAVWLRELLAWPISRPGSHGAMHIDGLVDELRGILETLTGSRGERS